jgi:hypothetical protein
MLLLWELRLEHASLKGTMLLWVLKNGIVYGVSIPTQDVYVPPLMSDIERHTVEKL